eukprot:scaffold6513_cov125-Isochrysis_galbana.AAC.10
MDITIGDQNTLGKGRAARLVLAGYGCSCLRGVFSHSPPTPTDLAARLALGACPPFFNPHPPPFYRRPTRRPRHFRLVRQRLPQDGRQLPLLVHGGAGLRQTEQEADRSAALRGHGHT